LRPQLGELALRALLGKPVGLSSGLREGQATDWSERVAGPT
jgi:hypothetical protein